MSTFERVALWNTVCGKTAPKFGSPEYFVALSNQAQRIEEELEELVDAITVASTIREMLDNPQFDKTVETVITWKGEDYTVDEDTYSHQMREILDAGCDLDVVVAGANFLAGHEYSGAIDAVLENNDAKYTHSLDFARQSANALGEGHRVESTHVEVDSAHCQELSEAGFSSYINNGKLFAVFHSVHRKSDDKICKMIGHPKVDLVPFTRTK